MTGTRSAALLVRAPEDPGTDPDRPSSWQARTVIPAALTVVVAVRLVYAGMPLRADEGGLLFLARNWDPGGGEFLYGEHHVDRPPLLLLVYRLAALFEWDGAIRVLTIPFVLATVLAVGRAGYLLAGWAGARWSAVVAAALFCSPALAADQADGQVFAAPFVAASVALVLQGSRAARRGEVLCCGIAAGVLAGAAVLVKQSFLEAAVFAAILVLAALLQRRASVRDVLFLAGGVALGLLASIFGLLGWMAAHDLSAAWLWSDLVSFRGAALAVIWDGHVRAPMTRAALLVVLGVLSLVLPIAWTWLRAAISRRRSAEPAEWAVTAMLLYAVWGLVAGGSYWPHYLLELAVPLALATALLAARPGQSRRARALAGAAALSAMVLTVAGLVVAANLPLVWSEKRTGEWLAASAAPGDSAVVTYGSASVLEAADLPSPYPYVWSLPMRTLDPEQARLRATLAGPDAPTWVVQTLSVNSWQVDRERKLRDLLDDRYRRVAVVCGNPVLLRVDVERRLAPAPAC